MRLQEKLGSDHFAALGGMFRRVSAIQWLIFSGVGIVLAITVATVCLVLQFRDRTMEAAEHELANTAQVLSRHFDQQLTVLQRIHDEVQNYARDEGIDTPEAFEQGMSTRGVHDMLRAKLQAFPHVGALNLFNTKGRLINSTQDGPLPSINISSRHYFKEFTSGRPVPETILEARKSNVTGNWTVVFGRRIVGRNGEIIGFASRGVEPIHFEEFCASLALDDETSILMILRDGTIIARYPHDDALVGRNIADTALFQKVLASNGSASGRFASLGQGEERLGSVRPLANFPILVVATTPTAHALADWWAQTKLQFVAALLAVMVVIITIFLIVRQLKRQHRAAQRLLVVKSQHLDTAINNMTQGLLLFSATGHLVICNQSYLDMFGLSSDVVKPGCHLRDLILHRKQLGSFSGDVDEYCAKFLDPYHKEIQDTLVDVPDGRKIRLIYKRSPDGGWATTLEDVTERSRFEARIEHLAHYDALTDLPNRTLFQLHAEEMVAQLPRAPFAILYIDIDEFKGINDSLGHLIGDEFLRTVSSRLKTCVGVNDFVARLGGDEFAVVQHGAVNEADVDALLDRIYVALRMPFDCHGHRLSADASIGVALAPRDGSDLMGLLKSADLAMYAAKAAGRRVHRFFEPGMKTEANARRELERDMRAAMAEGGFEVHYQPLADLDSEKIVGCEALLRWRHPLRGMISPAEFIPLAEETGLIQEIGQWVLDTACREAEKWPSHVRIAVNVSPVQFKSQTLALNVASSLAKSGLDPRRLELEITEAVLIGDDEAALTTFAQLRELGVHIALDDFGTGYSSLRYLHRFPFDKIKIDRAFVKEVTDDTGSSSIIKAVVGIATERNMITTA
ncbi:MAG TPA: EAL domain-containing protein, partial [Bradyrhizobium sp.]|nr:EAL domain-containing protein [Bradyrhizobium sp.]